MKMLPAMKQHGPFKDSDERREFETLSHSRRQSKESMTKLEKGLHSIHKYNDSTMNQQMKKILQSQTKINNRIQDLKQKQRPEMTRWNSLPRIDESEAWCEDPYPITFQSIQPISLSDGGKQYPTRQRRKSIEFEDIPSLSYNSTGSSSVTTGYLTPTPPKHEKPTPSASNQSPSTSGSPKLNRNPQLLHKSPLAQRKKIKEEIKENNVKQLTAAKDDTTENQLRLGNTRLVASAREPTASKTSPERDGPAVTHKIPEIVLSTIDKEMVVNSPLSKRKLNTVISNKSSSFVES